MANGASPRFVFVVNPTAGRGKAASMMLRLAGMLSDAGAHFQIIEARSAQEARDAARVGASTSEVVVAVGGDGTVHHVARGMLASPRPATLAVVPAGTGNDFARAVGMPRGMVQVRDVLFNGIVASFDYGLIHGTDETGSFESVFVNAAGVGFDAHVAARRLEGHSLPGFAGYAASAIRELPLWEAVRTRVTDDDSGRTLFDDELFLMSVGNGHATGGGFRLTPEGNPHDGVLDACIVQRLPLWRAFYLLPRAITGTHVGADEVTMCRAASLSLACDRPLPVHADGEIVSHAARSVAFRVVRGGIRLLTPPKSDEGLVGKK